jgi:hypothetical protein
VDVPSRMMMPVPGYDKPVEFGVLTEFAYPLEGGEGEGDGYFIDPTCYFVDLCTIMTRGCLFAVTSALTHTHSLLAPTACPDSLPPHAPLSRRDRGCYHPSRDHAG